MVKNSAKQVLVVDDDPTCLKIASTALKEAGFKIKTASLGTDALKILEKKPKIDVVVLDHLMPDVTGLDILKSIKQSSLLQHIPVIMLTVMDEQSHILDTFKAGAFEYLIKPINFNMLVELVQKAIAAE
jgi:DNA-binding NtrC family response regulator